MLDWIEDYEYVKYILDVHGSELYHALMIIRLLWLIVSEIILDCWELLRRTKDKEKTDT
jgi:hypothetical protein